MSAPRPTIVVAGALAQRPGVAGHAWVYLNWLLGLRALGFDVLFLDRLEPGMLANPEAGLERSPEWRWLNKVMAAAGMDGSFALLHGGGPSGGETCGGRACLGLDRAEVVERCRRAPLLLNFMGYLDDEEVLGAVGRRVFVDIDPGFPQLWRVLGLHDAFAGHDAFVTVGLEVGRPGCAVPDCGLDWMTTLPPVALDRWPSADPQDPGPPARVTSVCTWRGPNGPVVYDGVRYGLRVHEFRRFAGLPGRVAGARFELALDIDGADAADAERLHDQGWRLVDPGQVAGTLSSYRCYIQRSSAELMIAKEIYVASRGGWFSDRSACYLASGRPVVAQDTGFGAHLPTGEGLLTFTDADGAAAALSEVCGNPSRHAKAARNLALDHFHAERVLASLLARLEVA